MSDAYPKVKRNKGGNSARLGAFLRVEAARGQV